MLRTAALLGVAIGLVLVACGDGDSDGDTQAPTETSAAAVATATPRDTATLAAPSTPTPDRRPAAKAAIDALATWLGPVGEPWETFVASVAAVTWSNGCLDVARANQTCTQALVPGYGIDLALGDAFYEVRTDLNGDAVMWAPSLQLVLLFEEATTNLVTFTTDDGETVEAQPVAGTGYGVDLASLAKGDPVRVALADTPERDGFLLVWVDPVVE